MNSQEFLNDYVSGLEEEVFVMTRESKVLFDLIEEYRGWIESDALSKEDDTFLESLNMFEDVLDAKILISK